MRIRNGFRFLTLFLLFSSLLHSTLLISNIYASDDDWPLPFGFMIEKAVLGVNDPFVELVDKPREGIPALKQMLNSACYWIGLGMNHTQEWGLSYWEKQAINALLDQAYVDKYGLTAFQYHDQYNTTYDFPVVNYCGYSLIIKDIGRFYDVAVLITQVFLTPSDGYVGWNTSRFSGTLAEPFKSALENSAAWAHHGVNKTVFYFPIPIRDALDRAFNAAFTDKYNMTYHEYFDHFNATIYGALVQYYGYFFKFTFDVSIIGLPPIPFPLELLLVAAIAIMGGVIFTATTVSLRSIRNELRNRPRNEG